MLQGADRMTLLEDFYFGNIQPCEYEQSAEVRRKLSAMAAAEEQLKAKMPDDSPGIRRMPAKV